MNYQELLHRLSQDLPERMNGAYVYKMVMPSWFWIAAIIFAVIMIIWVLCLIIGPVYSVWASKKRGEAELAQANYAEQVAIAEATARLNSAEMNKQAEIIEAQAVSESINTIGTALERNEGYLRWQWIKSLADTSNEIIYVPTEANLPILEASRKQRMTAPKAIEE